MKKGKKYKMILNEVDKFLLDREARVSLQERLLNDNKDLTLITVRVNYPGIEKSNFITDEIHKIICDEISFLYEDKINFKRHYKNAEGYIAHFLMDLNAIKVKKAMIEIEENHVLGRCVDIDVYYVVEEKIITSSRKDLNKKPRKCFICDLDANICSRNQSHDIKDIKMYFENKYKEYLEYLNNRENIASILSDIATKAMIAEVSTYPSFGLVSPICSGSHKDMDYYTFLESSFAIKPYLKEMAKVGYSYYSEEDTFKAIRKVGVEAEKAMFEATNNVNTHKGMIFLLGIVITSVAKVIFNNKEFKDISDVIKIMVKDILEDFKNIDNKKDLTHGERLYKNFGFTGIRGQVKDGLAFIFDEVLEEYLNCSFDGNDLYSNTLIKLMSIVEDSTIVYRHDFDTLKKVQKDCKNLLAIGGISSDNGKILAIKLEKEYIQENISPGGSADLLAIVIFLGEVYKLYF